MRTLLLIISIPVLLASCEGYKHSLSVAQQYVDAGMHEEAMAKYLELYQEHPNKAEAHIGLKALAQSTLNKRFAEVRMLHGQGRYESALEALDRAEAFEMEWQWLNLAPVASASGMREEIRNDLANHYFTLANESAREERWTDAKIYLDKATRYGANSEELRYLEMMLEIVPDYKKGLKAMELGLFQEAYIYFEKVAQIDADFSEVLKQMERCLEEASFTVTYVHYKHQDQHNLRDKAIVTAVKEEILSKNNPFIRLVSRDDLDLILAEQQHAMSGAFDDDVLIEAGQLLGAEYVIVGEVLSEEAVETPVLRTVKKGYEGSTVISKKVEYVEKSKSVAHIVSFRYHLLDAETGEVIAAENIPYAYHEDLRWIEYDGDSDVLYPGNWKYRLMLSPTDMVDLSNAARDEIQELSQSAKRNFSAAELEQRFIHFIAREIAEKVDEFALNRRLSDE